MRNRILPASATPTFLVAALAMGFAACAAAPPSSAGATDKPVSKAEIIAEASPLLGEFLTKTLPGRDINGKTVSAAKLMTAKPFSEGHINETWFLVANLDGENTKFALKIFPTPEGAAVNAAQFRTARAKGWRVPTEYYRGAIAPYTDRHGLLMEFIDGGSLAKNVANKVATGTAGAAEIESIATMYGGVAKILGRLHEANRKKATGLRTAGARLRGLATRCATEGWCDPAAKARLEALAADMDQGPVTFTHGDLYEQQIILREDGALAAFIDLDHARYDDPAADVGAMLAHILIINTSARKATQGVPDATPAEAKATAERFLSEYRKGAWIKDDEWSGFLKRVKGHTYLRVADLLRRYHRNPHAKPLVDVLEERKKDVIAQDPFVAYGLTL